MAVTLYIGIDPGATGGVVAVAHGNIVAHFEMPTLSIGFDTYTLCKKIKKLTVEYERVVIITEQLRPIFGVFAGATFKLGMAYQNVLSALSILKIPYHEVRPTVWTKTMWAGIPEQFKPLKKNQKKPSKDTKKMSLMTAQKLNIKFVESITKRTKAHDGLIDAFLLAEYARRQNL